MLGYVNLLSGPSFAGEVPEDFSHTIQGEIVFYTGMTGYQEVLTDPSYKNQIVVFTYPLIGNYGVNEADHESDRPQVSGVIMLHCADAFYHHQANCSLKTYLEKWNIPYMTGVDTRDVTQEIRDKGTQQASISSGRPEAVKQVESIGTPYSVVQHEVKSYGEGGVHIGLIDFGYKDAILQSLLAHHVRVTVIPFSQLDKADVLSLDGLVLSNGPGDPKDLHAVLPKLKALSESTPTLGICLGHQLIALAYHGDTTKLTFGHRGANHPVKDIETGRVCITSQNHNYDVAESSLTNTELKVRFRNVNDQSVEGLFHNDYPLMTVQFHPEANPGPEDAGWIFDHFLHMVQSEKGEKIYA
ncbi:carbamoyl phosphate synthase small subunit [Thalassobacillus sp. CUG 92003]|uniref:carbamoyl phosphate synthase small subunit n=1 Tax=Thalassobacillus sp. CUG 92003 TaxID=2736641 RepID=UPI0015E76E47|nr:carbamoyl phosphate synthase small subunit [Thalassobacillus sp. CUG 92003]